MRTIDSMKKRLDSLMIDQMNERLIIRPDNRLHERIIGKPYLMWSGLPDGKTVRCMTDQTVSRSNIQMAVWFAMRLVGRRIKGIINRMYN